MSVVWCCLAACMNKSPAETRHSLFANATSFATSRDFKVGFSPATPTIAAIEISTGRLAASRMAVSPAPNCISVPLRACFNSSYLFSQAVATNSAPNSMACLASNSMFLWPVRAMRRKLSLFLRIISNVFWPIVPVAPNMEIVFIVFCSIQLFPYL